MKKIFLVLTLTSITLFAMSDIAKNGEELYIEAKCQKCHGLDMEYESKNDKIKTKHDLANWVKGCANNFNVGWFPKENEAVITYINEIYYNLEH